MLPPHRGSENQNRARLSKVHFRQLSEALKE